MNPIIFALRHPITVLVLIIAITIDVMPGNARSQLADTRGEQRLALKVMLPEFAASPAGVLSVPGVYGGLIDKLPIGALMNKGLTIRTGQPHVNRWTDDLLNRIVENQIDPSFVITHTEPLERGPEMYKTFRDKQDGCIKVVLKPGMNGAYHA